MATRVEGAASLEFWLLRGLRALGISPVWAAIGLLLLVALVTWGTLAIGEPIVHQRKVFERRVPFLIASLLITAYWTVFHLARCAEAAFDAMGGDLRGAPAEIERARAGLLRPGRAGLWLGAALGMLTMAAVQEYNVQRWSRFATGDWNAFDLWAAPLIVLGGGLPYQVLLIVFAMARRLGAVGGSLLEVRLFDPDLGRPIARFGLRVMLLFAVVPTLMMGIFQISSPGAEWTLLATWVLSLVVGAACLVVPSAGLRVRVRELKCAELRRVDRAVQGDDGALAESPMAEQLQQLGLVDLLAYRREVAAVREWPFDTPVVSRFALYVILPPASWVAAALVERFVDQFMGG